MTIPHDTATATLTIDGLAICCFNAATHVWDLAFLHNDDPDANPPCHHGLVLAVDRAILLPNATGIITFETVNPDPPDYANTYPHGFFDDGEMTFDRKAAPTTSDGVEDFRWVLNLEDPKDVPGVVGLKKPSVTPTRVNIFNAVFYTSAITSKDLYRVEDGVDPNVLSMGELGQALLGRTNDRIAADIFCAPGGQVVIKIDGAEFARLTHRPGHPWRIGLTNLCNRQPSANRFDKGDFHLFYDALTFKGKKLVIWGEPVAQALSNSDLEMFSGRTDCDSTRVGTSQNLDILFQ